MSHYYPKSYRGFSGKFSVKVDLSKYATKLELNEVTRIDTSNFALKSTLASAKTVVNETDVEKLKTVPVDWSKLSNVLQCKLNNDVVKKTVYNQLVAKVNNIYPSGFF